jgi:tetratricopeptide (TPR) repeat protein
MRANRPLTLTCFSEALLSLGRVAEARDCADEGLNLARQLGERGHEAWALWVLGQVEGLESKPAGSAGRSPYHEALILARELEMRPLAAHCHLGLGKLYWRTGKREQAQEYLTTATTMYREMGMTYWLEQAEAEMGGMA